MQQRGLGALANDTKWEEFFSKILATTTPLEIKLIDDEQVFLCRSLWSPVKGYVEGGEMGPVLYVFVEWIRSSRVEQLRSEAAAAGLECEVLEGTATVYGYR